NANYDGYANSRYTIAVTAITHAGEQSYYAEPGANILVAAHSNGDGEGITTTDIEGSGGYDSGNVTNNFGGTSSATPLAAGVIALILEANGNLTWRDIQYILVQSSRVNDPNDSSWEINGAGLNVSHKYGFGAIDAGAAVSLAENWTNVNMESNFSYGPFSPNTEITDNDETWNEFSVNITADIKIESIDIITDITHTSRGDLDIVLVSPSGKESWLAESRGDNGNGYSDWLFNTVHHWGEDAVGEWKLKMRDTVNSDVGTLNTWEIVIHGVGNFTDTDGDGVSDFSDTDDDGDGWSDIDEDACGTESLNLSSVPQDLDEDGTCNYIDLDDDGDGLSDNNETEVYNTDPYDPDMDGDGLTDYEEIIIYGTKADEVDSDSDGLDDYEEVIIYNTNPLSQDTDDDGLLDIEEINIGTNPNIFDADSDNDSFYHFEDCNDLNSNINPNIIELLNNLDDNCNDQIDEGYNLSDFDNDGLFDWEEYHIYGTNYTNHDTDGDGLNDSKEVYITFTDPLILDLDNDLDGWYWFEDCDDNMSNKYPGMLELLDGIDNDCD
ncbi:MAG: proprotein convertase P-domain-containing protein, partial [Candidatus Poseidoniales archaeon]